MSAPSTRFGLVYDFLVQNGMVKTAKAFAKEANVDFDDSKSARASQPKLMELIEAGAAHVKPAAAAVSGSKRKAAASSSSDDSDSSDSDDEKPASKKAAVSNGTSSKPTATPAKKSPAAKPTPAKKAAADSSSSSSDDSSDSEDEAPKKPAAVKAAIPPPSNINAEVATVKKESKPAAAASSSDSSSSDSDSDSDDDKPAPVSTPVTPAKVKSENGNGSSAPRSSAKKTPNAPFQRVKIGDAPDLPEGMRDNQWSVERAGGYGALAQAKLGVTRGKRFQHEKTKGKRGNYRGGSLDNEVRSFKFDD